MARPDQQPSESQPEEADQTQIQLSHMMMPYHQTTHEDDDHNSSQAEILNDHSVIQTDQSADHHNMTTATTTRPGIIIKKEQMFAIVSLSVRVATWICLLVSLIILASNTSTIKGLYRNVKIHFGDIYTYRYMMSAIVIGFAYTCVQLSLEIYQVTMGKTLTILVRGPNIIFYGDKFLLCLLATGVGAAFGATYDLKKNLDELDDFLESIGDPLISELRSKLDNFFNMAYVSAGFLLIAFLTSLASSILSSLALHKN